jgi:phage terminase large subunit-like protein
MTEPSKLLENLVLEEKLIHGNHPVGNWCASNVAIHMDPAGNIKPGKDKSTEKIDLIVCLIEALGMAIQTPEKKPSVYEKRGLLIL